MLNRHNPNTLIEVPFSAEAEEVIAANDKLFELVTQGPEDSTYLDHFYYIEAIADSGCMFVQPSMDNFKRLMLKLCPLAQGRGWFAKYSHRDTKARIGLYRPDGEPIMYFTKIGRLIEAELERSSTAETGMLLNIGLSHFRNERDLLKVIEAMLSDRDMELIKQKLHDMSYLIHKKFMLNTPILEYEDEQVQEIARAVNRRKEQVLPRDWPLSKLWCLIAMIRAAKELFHLDLAAPKDGQLMGAG